MSTLLSDRSATASHAGLSSAATPDLATRLPQFELLALVGRGKFTEVWQVRDRRTGDLNALKQPRADRRDHPAARQRLKREAEVAQSITDEHVVQLRHCELEGATPHLTFEWLEGQNLETYQPRGQRLDCREALWFARQCAQGLQALLTAGYTHGDIRPANLFLGADGRIKLTDLGSALPDQRLEGDLAADIKRPHAAGSSPSDGATSAEIARDSYQLGLTLYRMLTGVWPFAAEEAGGTESSRPLLLPGRLRSLTPEAPREVTDFVQRLLGREPVPGGYSPGRLIHELIGLELLVLPADG